MDISNLKIPTNIEKNLDSYIGRALDIYKILQFYLSQDFK